MKHNAQIVDSSHALPENFLIVWDKLYPNSRNTGMNNQLLSELTSVFGNKSTNNCKCDEIGYLAWNNKNHNFKFNISKGIGKYRRFGYGLQFYTTASKCFDFWVNNGIFWDGRYLKDLNELSIITLGKNVDNLNEPEIITLIAYRNLSYNQSKDTNKVRDAIADLTARLKNK